MPLCRGPGILALLLLLPHGALREHTTRWRARQRGEGLLITLEKMLDHALGMLQYRAATYHALQLHFRSPTDKWPSITMAVAWSGLE